MEGSGIGAAPVLQLLLLRMKRWTMYIMYQERLNSFFIAPLGRLRLDLELRAARVLNKKPNDGGYSSGIVFQLRASSRVFSSSSGWR
jgi:hypothetical protein